jgi:UDP-N-acetylmuramoylalanine-D-glutamate ligase
MLNRTGLPWQVLLNLTPDPIDPLANTEDYARAYAPLFADQQFFDWAIVQSEALTRLRGAGITPAAKTITFSATDPAADLVLNRGLLVSRLPNWPGPLLDLDHCLLRGPHNAENLMATLAVGMSYGFRSKTWLTRSRPILPARIAAS